MSHCVDFSVSVIVPVYNVEPYLSRCLESLTAQSLPDIEVILIDDGSTDRSLEICNKYAAGRDNWVVHSKINEGQGIARNIGIELAQGEFVLFVDSDDWVDATLCQNVVNCLRASNADFANFGLDFIDSNGSVIKQILNFSSSFYEGAEIFQKALLDIDVLSTSCNKMYRRTLFKNNDLRFPPLRANEDIYFSRAVAQASSSCIFINKVFYHALTRPGSTSRKMSVDLYLATKELLVYEESKFNLENPVNRELFNAHVVKLWTYLIIQGSFRLKDDAEFRRCIEIADKGKFRIYADSRSATRHLGLKHRMLTFLCQHPRTLRMLSRIAKTMGIQPY
jgi:glycosyltransferase involved in cell wall biosynthesis